MKFRVCKVGLIAVAVALSVSAVFAGGLNVFHQNRMPTKIVQGPQGKLYVSDPVRGSVFIYNSALSLIGELKGLGGPLGVAVDAGGRIFVGVDTYDRIEIYGQDGLAFGSIGEKVVDRPCDMAFDLDGNLYVVDSAKDKVFVFSPAGHLINSFGSSGAGNGQFSFPVSLTVAYELVAGSPVGEIYVVDQKNYRVQVFDLNGNYLRKFGTKIPSFGSIWFGRFNFAQSVVVDDLGQPHVLDSYLDHVQIFDAATDAYQSWYAEYGAEPGYLNLPLDIVMTDAGDVVVANAGNHRVEVIYSNATTKVQLSTNVVDEDSSVGALIGTLSAVPAPVGSNTFMFVAGNGGEDNSLFSITNNELRVAGTIDFEEQGGTCWIKIKNANSNAVNLMYGTEIAIVINDLNEGPTNLILEHNTVRELQPSNTLVGYLQALDPDEADTFTYAFALGAGDADNASFAISGSMLLTDEIFDYETKTNYSVRISAEDSGGSTVTNAFDIHIWNVGEVDDPDADGDGMPDWWEYGVLGNNTGLLASADADGDGVSNLDEWIAGTQADDYSEVFVVEEKPTITSNNFTVIRWPSESERLYGVRWTDDLMTPWSSLASNLPAAPPMNSYTDTTHTAETKGFYRIDVRLNQ